LKNISTYLPPSFNTCSFAFRSSNSVEEDCILVQRTVQQSGRSINFNLQTHGSDVYGETFNC